MTTKFNYLVAACLAVMVALAAIYMLLPHSIKNAGQVLRYNDRIWLVTALDLQDEVDQPTLAINLLSVWPQTAVALHHSKLRRICNQFLDQMDTQADFAAQRKSLSQVALRASLALRTLTPEAILIPVEDGKCTQKLDAVPPSDAEQMIFSLSAQQDAAVKTELSKWKNIRASFSTGVSGDGKFFEFAPKQEGLSLEDFDFLLICRMVLSRTPETQQTRLGLMDFLGRGHFSFRVYQQDPERSGSSTRFEHREFNVVNRDCVPDERERSD